MRVGNIKDIKKFIESNEKFIIIGHIAPDFDCFGSQLALGSFLRRLGKEVTLFNEGPFKRDEIIDLLPNFETKISDEILADNPAIIVVDCSTIDRIGKCADEISNLKCGIVDHHSNGEIFGDYHYIDSDYPSTTLLIKNIIEEFKETPTYEEAKFMFTGFCTDTGFFKHLGQNSGKYIKKAGDLVDLGISPKETFSFLFNGKSLSSRIYLSRVLNTLESFKEEKIFVCYENESVLDLDKDSDLVYGMLLGVSSCEVVILVKKGDNNDYIFGLRSSGKIDIGTIAESYGGGGHKFAAGFTYKKQDIKKVVSEIVSKIDFK